MKAEEIPIIPAIILFTVSLVFDLLVLINQPIAVLYITIYSGSKVNVLKLGYHTFLELAAAELICLSLALKKKKLEAFIFIYIFCLALFLEILVQIFLYGWI
ncbi:hypothetical protein [Muninn virus]|nr:hypothetical protein [Muninn virus]